MIDIRLPRIPGEDNTSFVRRHFEAVTRHTTETGDFGLIHVFFEYCDCSHVDFASFLDSSNSDIFFWAKYANFEGSSFAGIRGFDWDLECCNFKNADLSETDMVSAIIQKCRMNEADFSGAICVGTFFVGSSTYHANFCGTNLSTASFSPGSDLRGITYDDETDFTDAMFETPTFFSEDFDPIRHGMHREGTRNFL